MTLKEAKRLLTERGGLMLGRKRIALVFGRQCISPRTNKLGESLCGKMDKGCQWLEELKMPPIGRIRGPEIHLRKFIDWFVSRILTVVNLRMSGVLLTAQGAKRASG
jgi:hypothetical protein